MITAGVKYGLGRHTSDISKSDASTVIEYDYLAQTFGIAASCTGRLAFAIYIVGILGVQGIHRIVLWALMSAQLATNIMSILIMFLQCPGHGSAIWNWPQGGGCWNPRVQAYYGYFSGCKKRSDKSFAAILTDCGLANSTQFCNRCLPGCITDSSFMEIEYQVEGQSRCDGSLRAGNIVCTPPTFVPSDRGL